MVLPIIIYEVPQNQVRATIEAEVRKLEAGLNAGVNAVLVDVELTQIHRYTSSSMPSLPPGSRYQRTFTLRSASRTRRTGTHLPDISGEWYADEGVARYAGEVLGSRAEQKPIHRGRWKSTEEVEAEAQRRAPGILEEHLK